MSYEVKITSLNNVPQPNLDALLRVHHGLSYQNGSLVGEAQISPILLEQDISFTLQNGIPAENTASRLETYRPGNTSQNTLLKNALFLSQAKGRFMGLIALGSAGVGKSHIAIGLAKTLALQGQSSRYIHVPSSSSYPAIEPKPDETLVIDDLNSPYGWGRSNFASIITKMHHNGSGRLFITTNVASTNFDAFLFNMIGDTGSGTAEHVRVLDRVGAALRFVAVEGDSYRSSQREDPWADYPSSPIQSIES